MTLQVRSRLFTVRDYSYLATVIAHGFSHSELTSQARTHGITRDPGKVVGVTKPDRANVFVDTLLERPWPAGDEALLDLLSNAEGDGYPNESWPKARERIWKALSQKTDIVVYKDGEWHLLGTNIEADPHLEPTSAAPEEPFHPWPFTSPPSNESSASVDQSAPSHQTARHDGLPRVFVVQGRDQIAAGQVRTFLRGVQLNPLSWEDVKKECGTNPTTFDIVRKGLELAEITVVVLSGDDQARLRPDLLETNDGDHERNPTPQPRQNVLLEAGMALGMRPERTVMVRTTKLREISDFSGIHWVTMKGTPSARQDFAQELTKALKAADVSEPLKHAPKMWDEEALGKFSIAAP